MDESRKQGEMLSFVLGGFWPSRDYQGIELEVEDWKRIISEMLLRYSPFFNYLSEFVPISSLLNNVKENSKFVTDVGIVKFSEGIGFETHCHKVLTLIHENAMTSENEACWFEESEVLLITRKQEWVVWHRQLNKSIIGARIENITSYSKLANFEKVKDISQFLKKRPSDIIDNLYLWLNRDVVNEKERLKKKMETLETMKGFVFRAAQVS